MINGASYALPLSTIYSFTHPGNGGADQSG